MATPAERKAFLFIGLVALLGGAVRCWRSAHSSASPSMHGAIAEGDGEAPSTTHSAKAGKKKNNRSTRNHPPSDADTTISRDATVDLDVASIAEIEALGLLKPGQARQIVADRELYGPFGSIQELERIPYFPKSAIGKLAPRVTFSRLPRPPNTVIHPRQEPPRQPRRRTGRRAPDAGL